MRIVDIHTNAFKGEALALDEMPWHHVITAAIADPYKKRAALADILTTAIIDPDKKELLQTLTYGEFIDCLNAYLTAKPYEYDLWENNEHI